MASIKLVYGSTTETCWSDTSKITTPSLILNDNGTTRYTPLFSGNAGAQVVNGSYKYTLGHLIVGGNRVAIGRANNTYTNTVTVDYYMTESSVYTPAKVVTGCGSSRVYDAYTTYTRTYYVKVNSTSLQKGSLSYLDVDATSGHTQSTSWVNCYSTSSTSGWPSASRTIYIYLNGSWLSKAVTFSTSSQSATFTQTGTY